MKQIRKSTVFVIVGLGVGSILAACAGTTAPPAEPAAASTEAPAPTNQPIVEPASPPVETIPVVESAHIEPVVSTTFIVPFGGDTAIEGAQSTLTRMEHGLYMTFDTNSLAPGEAYTIWWIIFNRPQNCSDGICGGDDIVLFDQDGQRMFSEEGAPLANIPQREAAQISELRATGSIVDEDGTAEFRAHLPVGDAIEANYGPGLLDAMSAEVHLVARTHGPAIPGQIHEQMNTTWGGCPDDWPKDPCADTQVALHRLSQE